MSFVSWKLSAVMPPTMWRSFVEARWLVGVRDVKLNQPFNGFRDGQQFPHTIFLKDNRYSPEWKGSLRRDFHLVARIVCIYPSSDTARGLNKGLAL